MISFLFAITQYISSIYLGRRVSRADLTMQKSEMKTRKSDSSEQLKA